MREKISTQAARNDGVSNCSGAQHNESISFCSNSCTISSRLFSSAAVTKRARILLSAEKVFSKASRWSSLKAIIGEIIRVGPCFSCRNTYVMAWPMRVFPYPVGSAMVWYDPWCSSTCRMARS